MVCRFVLLLCAMVLVCPTPAGAQGVAKPSPGIRGLNVPDEPDHLQPGATEFTDRKYRLSFHVPAGWNFERKDGLLSNFGVDVRTTRRQMDVRGVAAINYNPYPPTTFAGATFYYSVMPRSTPVGCAAQASTGGVKPKGEVTIAGLPFQHGQDQHGAICTESRDDVFTTLRGTSCLRFDLVVNTFCSQTSGAMEISPSQLGDVNTRLGNMLKSIRIDAR